MAELNEVCFLTAKESLKKADRLLDYIRILDDIAPELVPGLISPCLPNYVKMQLEEAVKNQIVKDEEEFILRRTKYDLYQWHEGLIREALEEFAKCECKER